MQYPLLPFYDNSQLTRRERPDELVGLAANDFFDVLQTVRPFFVSGCQSKLPLYVLDVGPPMSPVMFVQRQSG